MRIAPDLIWTAFAGVACAAILAVCASITLAIGVEWTTEPSFDAFVTGSSSRLAGVIGAHTTGAVWAPQTARPCECRVNGTTSGYLVRAGRSSFGASVTGRSAAFASVLDEAAQRRRLFWSGHTENSALTPSIIALVSYHGELTSVLWRARNWTFEVTDASANGYALAREVEQFTASHRWPRGPGYAVVERSAAYATDSWTQWAEGDAIVGAADSHDSLGAVLMTSEMRNYRDGQERAGDGIDIPALQNVLRR